MTIFKSQKTWIKKGRLFEPDGRYGWMKTHAAVPFGEPMAGDNYRVYFSCRDAKNRARIGRFDLDLARGEVTDVDRKPVVDIGPLGAYDDHGIVGSWVARHDDRVFLYFSGMTLGVTVPFYFYLGLAVSDDDGATFRKVSPSPILGRDAIDPFLVGQVCVRVENGTWRMWYVSGDRWERDFGGRACHFYNIKYAESKDGIHWRRDGVVCVDFEGSEHAIARPCVLRDGNLYRMWFCCRGESYRLGYAESDDGVVWERNDSAVGMDPSHAGWDSEMLAYPFVFDHGGRRYMLYNGNGYGRTGLGWAVLEGDE